MSPAIALALVVAAAPPVKVQAGVFLRNAEAINLEQNAYNLAFTLWLTWDGEADAIKPLKLVNVLDGWALTQVPVYDEPLVLPDGRRYQRYFVEGRFFNKFKLDDYPFDAQQLVLELEDLKGGLVLEADPASRAREGLTMPGWNVGAPFQDVGSVAQPVPAARYRFGLEIARPHSLFLLTLLPPLLLVLICCWIVFLLRAQHVDARVGTVITALLTIVFLDLAYTDDVPYLAGLVLIDQIFNLAYVLLTVMLLVCVLAVRWKDEAADVRASNPARAAALEARIAKWDGVALRAFPAAYVLGCALLIAL